MNARRVTAAAGVILAAMKRGYSLPATFAIDLESAGLLQSPELAAELVALRARVAELEGAAEKVRHLHTDSPMGPCPTCFDGDAFAAGGDGLVPYPCPTARLVGATDCDPCHPCGCPKRFDRHADGCPVPQRQQEDPHDSPLHHDYAVPHDLPEFPSQRDRRAI